ncbi:4'-phosphopantetheinyl transferase family protein [Providencia sp. PROV080]|uniref:4'-phosphopantetheinyl transferase family protein n=1 Tax=Providencia sp. PROV080 TaxID=2936780 RepID=UPI002990103E|nr:4'-phosphopantetheinyl transferase superfamily protein [Providencia sp. PROV080]
MHLLSSHFKYSLLPSDFLLPNEHVYCRQISFEITDIDETDFTFHQVAFPLAFNNMVPKRRCEYLAGRICAKMALKQYKTEEHYEIISNPDRSPCWPNGIIGSITHTESIAAACIASESTHTNIGIDCEKVISSDLCKEIEHQVLVAHEFDIYRKIKFSKELFVTLIFSAKESIFKSLYKDVREVFDFNTAMLIELTHDNLKFVLTKKLAKRWNVGDKINIQYRVIDNHVFTSNNIKMVE